MKISEPPFLILLSIFILSGIKKMDKIRVEKTLTVFSQNDEIDYWLTKSDQSVLLQKQSPTLMFGVQKNTFPSIDINPSQIFQTIDGFGFTLTGGSASVINRMDSVEKEQLLQELFSPNAMAISYLRISIGASDLNEKCFTYDDMPSGETDEKLIQFSLNPDKQDLIPLLRKILSINPSIKILATPWSPPIWMKDSQSFKGGSLLPQYYHAYSQYFVKYIQQMNAEGIPIRAITPQNEPLHPGNNPSLLMTAEQQRDFIKYHLGSAFQVAQISTKIIIYDHNCDRLDYPLFILNDPSVKPYIWGSAFHLYSGDVSALTTIHNAHPDKHVFFTEQYTASDGNFGEDLNRHIKNVIIGSMRNWSRTAFEWNLANDAAFGPHTPGGCTTCKGALTIGNTVTRNVAYYIIAHASKFVPPGSVRIGSNIVGNLQNVAFTTPAGKKVLIVENSGNVDATFNIRFNNKWATTSLSRGAVATFIW